IEISELTADRFRLTSRVSELQATESTTTRQLTTLAHLHQQKEQDLHVLSLKHAALVEQVRLLEEELHMYRQSSFKRDIDMGRVKENQEELKRLKGQAEALVVGGGGGTRSLSMVAGLGGAGSASNLLKQSGASIAKLNVAASSMSRSNSGVFLSPGGGGGGGGGSPLAGGKNGGLGREDSSIGNLDAFLAGLLQEK
ncbi:hypothetical protein HDU98_001505, partial [Podochytrium sp. JEL0797]